MLGEEQDVSNIINFQQRYPGSKVHTLSKNFRSTQPIVEASNYFVDKNLGSNRIEKSPTASEDRSPQDFRVLWFHDRGEEAAWVARRIRDLLRTAYEDGGSVRGLTHADFAILMRSTRQEETRRYF